jgi:hypothetical protein
MELLLGSTILPEGYGLYKGAVRHIISVKIAILEYLAAFRAPEAVTKDSENRYFNSL